MNEPTNYSPLAVAIALSLYAFNVSASERAQKLYSHFEGNCADIEDLYACMVTARVGFAATELAAPTAIVYLHHALERYGDEAARRATQAMQEAHDFADGGAS